MKKLLGVLLSLGMVFAVSAEEPEAPKQVLFTNVKIFDGVKDKLSAGSVLVEGNVIKEVGGSIAAPAGAEVIDGGGRTLMPGLIDGHAHIMINDNFPVVEGNLDILDLGYRSVRVVERFLKDGFTTVRDMGGPTFALRRNIDQGFVTGPRIYPSGGFISQTSGHGDFRERGDAGFSQHTSGDISNFERMGIGNVADGIPEVLRATRINLRNGATQIKIMGGGGGSSRFDPIDTTQYSLEELTAIVEACKDWGTYAAAHTFNDRAVNRLMDAGVKSMEHCFFVGDETMKRMAKEGVFAVPQMWGISPDLARNPLMPADKIPMVKELGIKYKDVGRNFVKNGVKVVFASDYVGTFEDAERARRYEIWWRTQCFDGNFEVLKQLTSNAGELLALSGPRNPYGKVGVIEEGAMADILLVDGNPLEDITVIGGTEQWFDADPEYKEIETLHLIMKDGEIYKNKL